MRWFGSFVLDCVVAILLLSYLKFSIFLLIFNFPLTFEFVLISPFFFFKSNSHKYFLTTIKSYRFCIIKKNQAQHFFYSFNIKKGDFHSLPFCQEDFIFFFVGEEKLLFHFSFHFTAVSITSFSNIGAKS